MIQLWYYAMYVLLYGITHAVHSHLLHLTAVLIHARLLELMNLLSSDFSSLLFFTPFHLLYVLSYILLIFQLISQSLMNFGSQGNAMLANAQCRRRNARSNKKKNKGNE